MSTPHSYIQIQHNATSCLGTEHGFRDRGRTSTDRISARHTGEDGLNAEESPCADGKRSGPVACTHRIQTARQHLLL